MQYLHIPMTIIKTAVTEDELSGKNYILAKRIATTGYDWEIIKDENGENTGELCNIVGANPLEEHRFTRKFLSADNTFVFFIEERRWSFRESLSEKHLEYVATDWTVLYPVKHSDVPELDFFSSRRYITKRNVMRDE